MVDGVRIAERALGRIDFGLSAGEIKSRAFRRSLFVVENVRAGELFTERNVRSIRPGYGLPPRHLQEVLGRVAARDIERGTPLEWEMVGVRRMGGVKNGEGRSYGVAG
jgi:N-acetylneuraminate synthase